MGTTERDWERLAMVLVFFEVRFLGIVFSGVMESYTFDYRKVYHTSVDDSSSTG
jgi:hypothetical protein